MQLDVNPSWIGVQSSWARPVAKGVPAEDSGEWNDLQSYPALFMAFDKSSLVDRALCFAALHVAPVRAHVYSHVFPLSPNTQDPVVISN